MEVATIKVVNFEQNFQTIWVFLTMGPANWFWIIGSPMKSNKTKLRSCICTIIRFDGTTFETNQIILGGNKPQRKKPRKRATGKKLPGKIKIINIY